MRALLQSCEHAAVALQRIRDSTNCSSLPSSTSNWIAIALLDCHLIHSGRARVPACVRALTLAGGDDDGERAAAMRQCTITMSDSLFIMFTQFLLAADHVCQLAARFDNATASIMHAHNATLHKLSTLDQKIANSTADATGPLISWLGIAVALTMLLTVLVIRRLVCDLCT